jgi:hypothetical protein
LPLDLPLDFRRPSRARSGVIPPDLCPSSSSTHPERIASPLCPLFGAPPPR